MEDVERVIEDLGRILQEPVVAVRIVEKLAGEIGGADDDGAGHALVWMELRVTDAIDLGIDRAEVVEIHRVVRVLRLIVAQREKALAPIEVAVAEEFPACRGIHERREVREIAGSVAEDVGCVDDEKRDEQKRRLRDCAARISRVTR